MHDSHHLLEAAMGNSFDVSIEDLARAIKVGPAEFYLCRFCMPPAVLFDVPKHFANKHPTIWAEVTERTG